MTLPTPLKWVDRMIREHSQIRGAFETEKDYYTWIGWAVSNHFVVMNDPPTYVIMARPVSFESWVARPVGEDLFVVDHNGDALWMDFLWARANGKRSSPS